MYLEMNLKALSKRYPHYVQPILNAPDTGRYALAPTSNKNAPNLLDRRLNSYYYNNIDPIYAIKKDMEERDIALPAIGVFLGLGLAYDLLTYNTLFSGKAKLFIVFENDWELIRFTLTHINCAQFLAAGHVCLNFGPDTSYYYSNLYNHLIVGDSSQYLKAMNITQSGPAFAANKDYYTHCLSILREASRGALTLFGNDPKDSLWGIHNTFVNIDEIINNPGIKDLKNAFKNKPGIVVSTGPSLNKNIELLREVLDCAVIATPDASQGVLKERGMKPHFITSLERGPETAAYFAPLEDKDFEDVYFVACPVIHPETYEANKSKRIVAYRNFATFTWLDIDRGQFPIGPSAGNMAFEILDYMGCNPIILIGQDLAFAGEKTHAEGTILGEEQKNMARFKSFNVPGNYEPEVRTTDVWNMFRRYFENDIIATKATVINATEGGAKIMGAELMTFREAIDKFIKKKPASVLETVGKKLKFPFEGQKQKDRKNVYKKVTEALEYCGYVMDKLARGGEKSQEFINEILPMPDELDYKNKYNECLNALKDYDSMLQEEKFFLIFMHYVQSFVIKMRNDLNALTASDRSSKQTLLRYLNLYMEYCQNMIKLMEVMKVELMELEKHLTQKANNNN